MSRALVLIALLASVACERPASAAAIVGRDDGRDQAVCRGGQTTTPAGVGTSRRHP